MRVLQIIDTLHAGGAERMVVNYANALVEKIEFSGIVVTREEGVLQNQLNTKVFYSFLNKKSTLDLTSIQMLKKIVIDNKIDILHVHGTSFFTAFLLKMLYFKIKIVFHEHYGARSNQSFFKNIPLLFCSLFFNKIVVVNQELENWFRRKGSSKAIFFPNFASFEDNEVKKTKLYGCDQKRIICLANLKNPKNHQTLLKAFYQSEIATQDWTLHLVGKNYNDSYSQSIMQLVNDFGLEKAVYLYDSKSDISNILSQSTIGVLCSTSEGFPVTLLEYALAKLSVISSNVGFCPTLIINNETGLLFNPNSIEELVLSLKSLTYNEKQRNQLALNLYTLVQHDFSKEKIILNLISLYKKV